MIVDVKVNFVLKGHLKKCKPYKVKKFFKDTKGRLHELKVESVSLTGTNCKTIYVYANNSKRIN